MDSLKFCGKHPQGRFDDLQPCCLELGHEGHCRLWIQEPSNDHESSAVYGIRTYDAEDGHAIQFLEVNGESTPEEVAACVQYMELVR